MLDGQTLLLIFFAIILLFGPSKLPELARSLGRAYGEFEKSQIEIEEEMRKLETKPVVGNISKNITRLASDLGINTEGKDENMILDEIIAMIRFKLS